MSNPSVSQNSVSQNEELNKKNQKPVGAATSVHIHVLLVHPKMPSNTGNIIRLCANTGASLHLLEPMGFDLDDKKLRRAGLDYHEYANLKVHKDWQQARDAMQALDCQVMVALTTKLSHSLYEYDFVGKAKAAQSVKESVKENVTNDPNTGEQTLQIALVFGSETAGLPEEIRADIGVVNWLRLPMLPDSRSLNLSNSVAICLYEVWRQFGFSGDQGQSVGYDNLTPYDPK